MYKQKHFLKANNYQKLYFTSLMCVLLPIVLSAINKAYFEACMIYTCASMVSNSTGRSGTSNHLTGVTTELTSEIGH